MWLTSKKLAYLLLMLAIAGASSQALYAASLHNCEHHDSAAEHPVPMDEQYSQHDEPCCDDNCGCDLKLSVETSLPASLIMFQYDFSPAEISTDMTSQYTQYFHNPLLRPPIG